MLFSGLGYFLFYNAVFCLVVLFLAGTIMPAEEAWCPRGSLCLTSVVRGRAKLLKYPPGSSKLRHQEVSEMKERVTGPCNHAGIIHQHCKDASCIAVYRPNEGHFTKVELPVLSETLLASLKAMWENCHKEPIHLDTCLLCPCFLNGWANLGPKLFHTDVSKWSCSFTHVWSGLQTG